MYDNTPQNPYRSKPGRRKNQLDPENGDPSLYTLEQIIERAEAEDPNVIEWLTGIVPDKAAPPKDFLRCSKCGLWWHKSKFSPAPKNTGRGGKRSDCKRCVADAQYLRDHERMMRRINAVSEEVKRVFANLA